MRFFIIGLLVSLFSNLATAACASPAGVAGQLLYSSPNMQFCDGTNWQQTQVSDTGTACTTAGVINYNGTALVFCNGTHWISMSGHTVGSCSGTTAGTYTYDTTYSLFKTCDGTNWHAMAPNRGFFVMTSTSFASGNLGGLTGANATCLSDLTTNGFKNGQYGQLDSAHVQAFLCDSSTCQNLSASTVYYFGLSGSLTVGGASFTTDASGLGPNNSTAWNTSTTFNTTSHDFWTGRASTSATAWANTVDAANCTSWTSASSSILGRTGQMTATTAARWTGSSEFCNIANRLICMVNP